MGFDYKSLATNPFQMPDGWKLTSIQEVAKVNEKAITPKNAPSHIRYIDIASVDKGKLLDIQELSFEEAPSRARRVVQDKDSLISTVRPNLEHYLFVKEPEPNTIASTGFAVVSAKSADPRFLYYYMTSKPFTAYLTQIAESHTSAYPAFNPDVIEQAELILPKDNEQRAIAHILGSLDDKIELNRRMNQTLEAMARAIFKHWFIDFEFPNENGEPYKSSGGEMIDSPLGPIPKGWSTSKFSDTISVNPSRGLKKGVCAKKVRMTDIEPWRSYVGSYTEGIYKSGPKFQNGDVLLARITPSLENGKTAFVSFLKDGEVAYGSTEFIVFAPRVIKSSAYIYCLVRSDSFRDYAIGSMNGSSGRQRVPNDCLDALEIALPAHNLINEFEKIAKTLFSKIDCKGKENVLLSELRDSLLPKLMSGEIRVPVSEKEVDQF